MAVQYLSATLYYSSSILTVTDKRSLIYPYKKSETHIILIQHWNTLSNNTLERVMSCINHANFWFEESHNLIPTLSLTSQRQTKRHGGKLGRYISRTLLLFNLGHFLSTSPYFDTWVPLSRILCHSQGQDATSKEKVPLPIQMTLTRTSCHFQGQPLPKTRVHFPGQGGKTHSFL